MATHHPAPAPPPSVPHVPIPPRGVNYRQTVNLAPMVRSGELPSRLLALHYGADLVWGPETIDRSLIGCTAHPNPRTSTIDFTRPQSSSDPSSPRSLIYRLHPALESSRLVFQLGTASPTTAVLAASLVAPHVAGIDVNAGCPKPFSTSGGMGAALLRTPDLLCAILRALVAEVGAKHDIGISVKIRVLPDAAETAELVAALCQTGITGLTVHCRTPSMRPREAAIRAQLRMVAGICREHGVACLMNGDVVSRAAARGLVSEYGVDGAMIATAAETNPSVFLEGMEGKRKWEEVARKYMEFALLVENKYGNSKYLLTHHVPGKMVVKLKMNEAKGYVEMCERLGWEDLRERAREVDGVLGVRAREGKARAVEQAKEREVVKAAAGGSARRKSEVKRERGSNPGVMEGQRGMEGDMCSPMYAAGALTS